MHVYLVIPFTLVEMLTGSEEPRLQVVPSSTTVVAEGIFDFNNGAGMEITEMVTVTALVSSFNVRICWS